MENYEWSAWLVGYNPQSEMYDVYSRRSGETRVHSSWKSRGVAESVANRLNEGEQI